MKPWRTRAAKALPAMWSRRAVMMAASRMNVAMIAVTVGFATAHDHSNAGSEGSSGTRGSTCWVSA